MNEDRNKDIEAKLAAVADALEKVKEEADALRTPANISVRDWEAIKGQVGQLINVLGIYRDAAAYNGGGATMSGALNRIERREENTREAIVALKAQIAVLAERLDNIEGRA